MNREAMIEEIKRVMIGARLDHCLAYNRHYHKDWFVAERLFEFFEGVLDQHAQRSPSDVSEGVNP